jgi:hypothetical protein
MYKFAAASKHELIVFGSARPGYGDGQVKAWLDFMQHQGIQRICCLLPEAQLARYTMPTNLLAVYQQAFGNNQVCWAPIEDFHFASPELLTHQILPFLAVANQRQEKVVVHCSGGIGRTGHVLAAWLVAGRGFSSKAAIAAVKQTGRNPYEAVIAAPLRGQTPWSMALELTKLLEECQRLSDQLEFTKLIN